MVKALNFRSNDPGRSPGQGHCVVFLGWALHSHSAPLYPSVQIGTGEFNAEGNLVMD